MSPFTIAAPADLHFQRMDGPIRAAPMRRSRCQARRTVSRCASACLVLALALSADAAQALYFGHPGGTVEIPGPLIPAEASRFTVECRIKILTPPTQEVVLVSQWKDLDGDADKASASDQGRFRLGLNPTGRMGTPQEMANAVAFIASPRASFITGANLVVDGALTKGVQL